MLKSAIREVAAIANRKKVAVRAAFFVFELPRCLKSGAVDGADLACLVNCVACCRRGRSDAAF